VRTMKRAAIGIAVMAGIGIIAGVYVMVKDVVWRDDTGKLQPTLTKVKEKDQLFALAGRDVKEVEITIREVDYGEDEEASFDESEGDEPSGDGEGEADVVPVEERKLGLARVGDDWVLTRPVHALAAKGEADGLVTAVADMRVSGKYEDVSPNDPQYGLTDPCVIVRVWPKRGDEIRILLGKDTPIESKVYLTVEGSKTVYVADSTVKTSLTKKPEDLREKKVVDFAEDDVKRVILDHGGQRIVCEQEGSKTEKEWWLTKPVRARAETLTVEDLVRDAKGIEAKEFIDDVKSLGTLGLDKPELVARIDFGKGRDDTVIKFGRTISKELENDDSTSYADDSGGGLKQLVYCMARGRDEVFLVDAEIMDKLAKEPIDLRDRGIVDFSTSDVEKIAIKRKKGTSFELHKSDTQWVIDKPEFANADNSKIDSELLWDLKDIEAGDFLEDEDVSLAKAGLVNPNIEITLTLKDKDRPLIISFGYQEKGGTRYYCKTNEMQKPVLIDDTFLDAIPDELEDLKAQGEDDEDAALDMPLGGEEEVQE